MNPFHSLYDPRRRTPAEREAAMNALRNHDDPNDAEDEDILREDQEHLAAEIEGLRPADRLVYDIVAGPIADAVRPLDGRHTLIVLRIFSDAWIKPTVHAARLALRAATGRFEMTGVMTKAARAAREFTEFDLARLPEQADDRSCICVFGPGEEIPAALDLVADARIEIAEPGGPAVRDLAASLSGRTVPEFPSGFSIAACDPLAVDLAIRRAGDGEGIVRLLVALRDSARPAAPPAESSGDGPRLEDLAGYGEAKAWALQLVADLRAYAAGEIGWRDVDAGCLLVGPPGTGKTLFASALARSAGVSFFPTSYADWQSSRLPSIRRRCKGASQGVHGRRRGDARDRVYRRDRHDPGPREDTRADDWWTAITTALLESLDGIDRREGVVVIAACNHAEGLDPALVRAGRLDRRFDVELPDEAALAEIFRSHLGADVDRHAIDAVATLFAGSLSGADVVRIARDARRKARTEGRPIRSDDLAAVCVPEDHRSPALRRRIAIHEAGHAVARMHFGTVPQSLSLVGSDGAGGSVRTAIQSGLVEGLRSDVDAMVVPLLAGRAAEEVILGAPSAGAGGRPIPISRRRRR